MVTPTKTVVLLSTIDGEDNAHQLAEQLVRENLAACVNIIPNLSSVYKWKGRIETAAETLLILKTAENRVEELIARLVDLHPYELPEAVALPIDRGHLPYLEWVNKETEPPTKPEDG